MLCAGATLADDEAIFITSASLTEAALDRNIEIGLLVRDRAVTATVPCHFRGLIDRGMLLPLTMARRRLRPVNLTQPPGGGPSG